MSSTLYDLLNLGPAASSDEIRSAWRARMADLEPGDRMIGVLNDAAAVLLDPARRSAYDASIVPADEDSLDQPVAAQPSSTPEPPSRTAVEVAKVSTGVKRPWALDRGPVPSWLLIVLAVLTAVIGAGAIALATLIPSNQALADATSEAEATAQRAVTTIFSYDYRHLDADHDAAAAFLTPSYRSKAGGFEDVFALIRENAPAIKLKVEGVFVASGVIRTGGDESSGWLGDLGPGTADRVQVLVMFDQVKTSAGSTNPVTFRNFATLTMQKLDGTWLVDGIEAVPVQK